MKRRNFTLNFFSAKSTRLIITASLLAFGVIGAALWFSSRQTLPKTPALAFEQVVKAMRQRDEKALRCIAAPEVVNQVAIFQDEKLEGNSVYDYLIAKGVKPELLKERWGLWQQWAKQINTKEIKTVTYYETGTMQKPLPLHCDVFTGKPDQAVLTFEQQHNGWLLVEVITSLNR